MWWRSRSRDRLPPAAPLPVRESHLVQATRHAAANAVCRVKLIVAEPVTPHLRFTPTGLHSKAQGSRCNRVPWVSRMRQSVPQRGSTIAGVLSIPAGLLSVVRRFPGYVVKPHTRCFAFVAIRTATKFDDCACCETPLGFCACWWRFPGCAAGRRTLGFEL